MKNFINFHVLISHSSSCLNRDDMNMQKSAVFGGVRRVRISSQSLKRAIRKLGQFTKKCIHEFQDRYPEDLVIKAIEWLSGKEGIIYDTEADAVAPWVMAEVAKFCEAIKVGETDEGFETVKNSQRKLRKKALNSVLRLHKGSILHCLAA